MASRTERRPDELHIDDGDFERLVHCVRDDDDDWSLCGRDVSTEPWSSRPVDCVVCVSLMQLPDPRRA